MEVAVVGAGWAGLAAAVEATRSGAHVTLFEMAPAAGGRARDVISHGMVLDNGAHICIGAYVETLRLLRLVGVDERRGLPAPAADAGRRRRLRSQDARRRAAAGVRPRRAPSSRLALARSGRPAPGRRRLASRRISLRSRADRRRSHVGVAGRRAARLHRAALRRRTQHAGRAGERHGLPARPARRARLDPRRGRPAAAAARPRRSLSSPRARLARAGRSDDPPGPSRRANRAEPQRLARRRGDGRSRRRSPRARSRRLAWCCRTPATGRR